MLDGAGVASDYAALLLDTLGVRVQRHPRRDDAHPAVAWADSGAMALTGRVDGPAWMCPAPLASCIEGVRAAICALTDAGLPLPGAETLGERAAISGLQRNGAIAPGGACRLLHAADGWLAVNLPREDDWALLPAWLEDAGATDWERLSAHLATRGVRELVARAQLLGLAVACTESVERALAAWCVMDRVASPLSPGPSPTRGREAQRPLVIDLSSLWAGPLCSHLLQLAGARVIKVESLQRPDGARRGPAAFHDLMNHGKASVALDFASPRGIAQLRALLSRADIVIEAARPRALRQLGLCAEGIVDASPGLTWVSITGHGRRAPQEDWIAFGDDAGVAAGLTDLLHEACGERVFCGDAIADPLAGWHAALAALAVHRAGGGRLISLALTDVVRHCLNFALPASAQERRARWQAWQAQVDPAHIAAPRARQPAGAARTLGADTAAILAEFGIAC